MALRLRLYIAGNGPNSQRAVTNLRAICAEHFQDDCKLEIVDLLMHPARALADRVVVTPTLIRLRPGPEARAIGNLSDTAQLLLMLGQG
ncbi:MAG: circadian clock KaiB family protein [Acidobacteriota bacterium]|nr:circadian clock KaiB family protein [Acidobacteriota bacterium]